MADEAALRERIRTVDPVHADTMGRRPTAFSVEPLPFYRRFALLRAAVDLPHRELEFRYADDGRQLVPLTGKPADVYRVNGLEGLALTPEQVPSYLRFFLAVAGEDEAGPRDLAEWPGDLPWLPGTEDDASLMTARVGASARLRALTVSAQAHGYRAVVTVAQGRRLLELVLDVDAQGGVDVESSRVVFEDLPVAAIL
jgi:hypothetical protein